ncbi:MAG TPA: hypothetical protein VLK88_13375 [Gemmatimonadales bacterium]|nr:hypothetical protein [Gemmatimonadales bacterium]
MRSRAASTCRGARLGQTGSHFPERAAQGSEFRCPTLRLIWGQRVFSKNVAGPSDQLVDRAAQLPGEVAAHTNRQIQDEQAQGEYRSSETGVVIPGVRLGPLHPAQCPIELPEVRRKRLPLGWTKPG